MKKEEQDDKKNNNVNNEEVLDIFKEIKQINNSKNDKIKRSSSSSSNEEEDAKIKEKICKKYLQSGIILDIILRHYARAWTSDQVAETSGRARMKRPEAATK